jgi:hypothetical protein
MKGGCWLCIPVENLSNDFDLSEPGSVSIFHDEYKRIAIG